MLRVGELIRHELAALFARDEIMDEELYGITLTVPEVRVSPDLKLASAYIMPLGGAHAGEVVKALNRNKKFIRGRIVPRLNLKYAPDIRFLVDETFEEADRIESLLRSERVARDLHPDEDREE